MTDRNPYKTGDPVVDLAQGRPMVVLEAPDRTVAEWSDANNYDLTDNYANGKLGTEPGECVVRCAYVSDIRSEPSKDYTFPVSRVCLIDVHHADDGRRVYDRVAVDVLRRLFVEALPNGPVDVNMWNELGKLAEKAGLGGDGLDEARELADVERRFGGEDG